MNVFVECGITVLIVFSPLIFSALALGVAEVVWKVYNRRLCLAKNKR